MVKTYKMKEHKLCGDARENEHSFSPNIATEDDEAKGNQNS